MTEYFGRFPQMPRGVYLYSHEHIWHQVGAQQAPNGVWFSVWECELCPDVGSGGPTGPIPPGYCQCGWVQKRWPRKRCEECKRPLT